MKTTGHLKRSLLKSAVGFHGHLGPYLVLGLRIGHAAVQALHPHGRDELYATIWTSKSPPESCILDGIQISSGCTLGRGNLRTRNASKIKARFREGNRSVVIRPAKETVRLLLRVSRLTPQEKLRKMARLLNCMPDGDLLVVDT